MNLQKFKDSDLFAPICIALVWLMAVSLIFVLCTVRMGINANPEANPSSVTPAILRGFMRWDSSYYRSIATVGYGESVNPKMAFFPLFPLLLNLFTRFGVGIAVASLIINGTAVVFAAIALFKIAKHETKDKLTAINTLLLFLVFPTAFFLLAMYTEALFCCLSFWAIYFARTHRWWFAALFAALCTAVRLPGLLIAIVLAIEYLEHISWNYKKLNINALAILLAPIGLVAYITFLAAMYGDPIGFIHAYKAWNYQVFNPNILQTVGEFFKRAVLVNKITGIDSLQAYWNSFIELASWLLPLIIVILAWKKMPISYRVYILLSLLLFSLNSNLTSVNRYILPLFPMYIVAAEWLGKYNPYVFSLVLCISALCLGFCISLFAGGFWIA